MSEVIYRKYRARTFAEIQTQVVPVTIITQSLRSGNFAHAYLFAGPRGTGKTSMARLVAKALNCTNFEKLGDVCNKCEACQAIESGSFLDLYEIDAASNRGIDEIRQLKENINFLPVQGKYKVYIIDEVHMLTREAFNALLKTLEEPPAHAVFILATTEPHKVPVTILSRVQRFDFKLAQLTELTAKLKNILTNEGFEADDEVYDLVFTHSEGSFRDAESLLGKVISSIQGKNTITSSDVEQVLGTAPKSSVEQLIQNMLAKDTAQTLQTLDKLQSEGVNLARLIQQIANALHVDIVKNLEGGANFSAKVQLLSGLTGLQAELKQIDDTRLLIDIFVLKMAGASTQTVASVSTPTEPEPPKKIAKTIPEVKITKPSTKKNEPKTEESSKSQLTAQWDQLVAKVRKFSFKYWTMIKICSPELEGNKLTIHSIYPSTLQSLQSEDVIGILNSAVADIFGAEVKLEFAVAAKPAVLEMIEVEASAAPFESNADLIEAIL